MHWFPRFLVSAAASLWAVHGYADYAAGLGIHFGPVAWFLSGLGCYYVVGAPAAWGAGLIVTAFRSLRAARRASA